MRGPDRSAVYDYVREHPDTDVRRIVADLYPDASPYDASYLRGRVAHHLTELRKHGRITGEYADGSRNMKIWRAVE